jgi:hypothetical protein
MAIYPKANPEHTPAIHQSSRYIATGSKGLNCNGYLLVALSVIILIGSLAASGCLYPHIGYSSLIFGGVGLVTGLGLIAIALGSCKTSSHTHIKEQSNLEKDEKSRPQNLDRKCTDDLDIMPQTKASFADISENNGKDPRHRVIEQSKIPIRASDIDLPKILPKDIPSIFDISGNKWVSNSHLNGYITYLATRFHEIVALDGKQMAHQSHKWYSIDALPQYIFEYLPKQINNFNHLNIPFYLDVSNLHWTLVYIDRGKRMVEYYDSKKHFGNHREIVKKLTTIAATLSKQEPNKPPYTFVLKINKVLQLDGYQCGVWTLFFLENRLINPEFDFNQLNVNEAQDLIKKYRIKVMLKLIEMDKVSEEIAQQEQESYNQFYKDKALANKMYNDDLDRISYIDRWRQVLNGHSLVPGQ